MRFAAIGNREITDAEFDYLKNIAAAIHEKLPNITIVSGGSKGSDTAFVEGFKEAGGRYEIYIPWRGFNGLYPDNRRIIMVSGEAIKEVKKYAPYVRKMATLKLLARNLNILFSKNMRSKVLFVVAFDKKDKGGTKFTRLVAEENGIPVFNIAEEGEEGRLMSFVDSLA